VREKSTIRVTRAMDGVEINSKMFKHVLATNPTEGITQKLLESTKSKIALNSSENLMTRTTRENIEGGDSNTKQRCIARIKVFTR